MWTRPEAQNILKEGYVTFLLKRSLWRVMYENACGYFINYLLLTWGQHIVILAFLPKSNAGRYRATLECDLIHSSKFTINSSVDKILSRCCYHWAASQQTVPGCAVFGQAGVEPCWAERQGKWSLHLYDQNLLHNFWPGGNFSKLRKTQTLTAWCREIHWSHWTMEELQNKTTV